MKSTQGVSETLTNKIKVMSAQFEAAQKNVDKLTQEFNESVNKAGATDKATQELAKKLADAEKEAGQFAKKLDEVQKEAEQSEKALDDCNKEIEDTGKKAEKSGNGLANFAGKLGKGLATAAKIGGAAVGAAAAGIAALTKSAVENYAEYEQLVGGVETLFNESADRVKQYANEAYKSAGLSANEYMSTVTGFSASLLQSLGRGAQTDLDALKENLDEQYDATKKSWDDRIKLAKKFKQRNVDELISQRDAELKALKKTNEQRLADAEAANNKSVVTAETQALAADLANQAVIDMADNAAKMG